MPIFNMFSNRTKALPEVFLYDQIPAKLRQQLVQILQRAFEPFNYYDNYMNLVNTHLRTIVTRVREEHGLPYLCNREYDERQEFYNFVLQFKSDQLEVFLDLLEWGCRVISLLMEKHPSRFNLDETPIDEINYRFRQNGIGFQYVPESGQLIKASDSLLHQDAIQPALRLLAEPHFATANSEFLEAFDDYKKSDFDDCLTKCGKAFESVMKVICHHRKWSYNQTDTAKVLLDTIRSKSNIPAFLDQPLLITAMLRNKLSAHGGGAQPMANVPEHLARYALHSTASAILFLAEETKK
jgi:hypothetical protein